MANLPAVSAQTKVYQRILGISPQATDTTIEQSSQATDKTIKQSNSVFSVGKATSKELPSEIVLEILQKAAFSNEGSFSLESIKTLSLVSVATFQSISFALDRLFLHSMPGITRAAYTTDNAIRLCKLLHSPEVEEAFDSQQKGASAQLDKEALYTFHKKRIFVKLIENAFLSPIKENILEASKLLLFQGRPSITGWGLIKLLGGKIPTDTEVSSSVIESTSSSVFDKKLEDKQVDHIISNLIEIFTSPIPKARPENPAKNTVEITIEERVEAFLRIPIAELDGGMEKASNDSIRRDMLTSGMCRKIFGISGKLLNRRLAPYWAAETGQLPWLQKMSDAGWSMDMISPLYGHALSGVVNGVRFESMDDFPPSMIERIKNNPYDTTVDKFERVIYRYVDGKVYKGIETSYEGPLNEYALSDAMSGVRFEPVDDLPLSRIEFIKNRSQDTLSENFYKVICRYVNGKVCEVIKTSHKEVIKFLMERGADIGAENEFNIPFVQAIETNNVDIVKFVLDINDERIRCGLKRADSKEQLLQSVSFKMYPLYLAALLGNLDMVKCLDEHGADKDQVQLHDANDTALHIAARRGYFEIVEYLVNKGATLFSMDEKGENPLQKSILATAIDQTEKDINFKIFKFLYLKMKEALGNDEEWQNWKNKFLESAATGGKVAITEFLLSEKANIGIFNSVETTLKKVISNKNIKDETDRLSVFNFLVEHIEEGVFNKFREEVEVDLFKGYREDILNFAVDEKKEDIAIYLINTAPVKYKKSLLYSALGNAVKNKDPNTFLFLVNTSDESSRPLLFAPLLSIYAQTNELGFFSILLEAGAKINHEGHSAWSLLHQASAKNSIDIVEFIFEKLYAENPNTAEAAINLLHGTDSPLSLAVGNKHSKTAEFLVQKGAEIKIESNVPGSAPILLLADAIESGQTEMVKILLESQHFDAKPSNENEELLKLAKNSTHADKENIIELLNNKIQK